MKSRSAIARGIVAVVYVSLGILAFVTGKAHTIYAANPSPVPATVTVGSGKAVTVKPNGIRIVSTVQGQRATIKVEYKDGRPAYKAAFVLPLHADRVVVPVAGLGPDSIPLVIEGDQFLEER